MKIGFIGLGIMGESMCENIVKKHDDKVYVSDLNKAQVEKLASIGAVACENNIEVAENADVIITMVPKSEHVKAVYAEILPKLHEGMICIDMSTIDPSVSVEVAETVKKTGAQFADAPVVKSKPAAISGTLGILVGCEEELFPAIKPILSYMGCNIIRMGENGKGLVMKICHNALVAQIQNGVNETMLLAQKMGLSVDDYYTAISYGGGQCFYLDGQWQNLKNENWTTAFSLENEHKDLGICQRLSEQANFKMPVMEMVKKIYDKGVEAGIGKEDWRATYKIVRGDYDA
ncbi:MAG: NAD(P)-dependent oxidoreductase [Faecalibacterium sp.]|nr:NAD(P)-dependent oxidoreductase [Ruminococcus sp.]MCM1391839.1 NAD(P)-dependent oxidoreductase [Ruminococcus sp.]MCM1485703.1 NAD(P)-dependent oxidoreductase [Faecalibacterium sp.]